MTIFFVSLAISVLILLFTTAWLVSEKLSDSCFLYLRIVYGPIHECGLLYCAYRSRPQSKVWGGLTVCKDVVTSRYGTRKKLKDKSTPRKEDVR